MYFMSSIFSGKIQHIGYFARYTSTQISYNMKPRLTLLLIFCTFAQVLSAQDQPAPKKWGVHITPTSLVNYYPRFRVGTQYMSERYSYLLDVSYANFPSFWGGSNYRKGFSYLAIRPEIRRFITSRPEINSGGLYTSDYWGLELALSHFPLRIEGDAYEATDGEQYSFDEATRLRRQLAVHLKYGTQRIYSKVHIDLFVGVGLRLQHLQYQDVSGQILRFDNPAEEWLISIESKREGWSLRPSLTLGLRLGIGVGQ